MKWMIKGAFSFSSPSCPSLSLSNFSTQFPTSGVSLTHCTLRATRFSANTLVATSVNVDVLIYSPRELSPVLRPVDDGADFGVDYLVLGVCDAGERVDS